MKLPYDLATPHLKIYPNKSKTLISKEYMHPYDHCSIIYNNQYLEVLLVPISRRVDQKAVEHLHKAILLAHIKEGNHHL